MADFLLIFEEIPYYNKNDVDTGLLPIEIYKLCSCIRETFCLSYSIRKNNNLFLFVFRDHILIKFQGNKLRFLGSDERSQAILLNKAINKTQEIDIVNRWSNSTPGILVKKLENLFILQHLIDSFNFSKIIVFNNYTNIDQVLTLEAFKSLRDLNDYLFILSNFHIESKVEDFFGLIKKLNNVKFAVVPKIKNNENKILYINFIIDQQTRTHI